MNAIKCPACGQLNSLGQNFCMTCGASLANSPSAQVSLSPAEHARAFGMPANEAAFVDLERGKRVFFWYRIYAGSMAAMYAMLIALGIFVIFFGADPSKNEQTEALIGGLLYAVLGAVFFLIYAAAFFLPRKPWAWIYHIVLICIGLTSCCLLPATIPLLIYWLKPETKALFGRR